MNGVNQKSLVAALVEINQVVNSAHPGKTAEDISDGLVAGAEGLKIHEVAGFVGALLADGQLVRGEGNSLVRADDASAVEGLDRGQRSCEDRGSWIEDRG